MPKIIEQTLTRVPPFLHLVPSILMKKAVIFDCENSLPLLRFRVQNITLDAVRIQRFNQTVHWRDNEAVHPGYLHTLAFPLQIKLMLHQQFPFSVIGLVHLYNHIEQYKVVLASDRIDITCEFGEITKSDIGWKFLIASHFYVNGVRVLSAQHQYLKRNMSAIRTKLIEYTESTSLLSDQQQWALNSNLGRLYANCSGDYNPIHLYPLTAKLFGFKGHIVHGMWLKSRVISALFENNKNIVGKPFKCEVTFKKPLYLPNNVGFYQQAQQGYAKELNFAVKSAKHNLPVEHMTGRLTHT